MYAIRSYYENEYPTLQVYRALKLKAFEDDEVIKEKCKNVFPVLAEIFPENPEKTVIVKSLRNNFV